MTEIINDIDIQRALKLYASVKKKHNKYVQSEKGREAVCRASAKYKEKKMSEDPEWLEKRRARGRALYKMKKEMSSMELLPDIEK